MKVTSKWIKTVTPNTCEIPGFQDFANLQKALVDGTKVEIRGFGTFFTKKIKEKHSARNPKTGEIIYVPEKNRVRFKTSKKLKKFINE